MQSKSRNEETFAIILHLLWECRNVFADLNEHTKSNYVENCIKEIVYSHKDGEVT
jgi:hypothetical protein